MENILELQQISKTFSKSNFTLDKVSFSLPYGSILGFVGENGAGKTTTIGCILNTIKKDSGTIKLFGKEMSDDDTDIREKIGIVYDGDNFPGFWTAKQLAQVMEGLYTQWDNDLFQKYLEEIKNNHRANEITVIIMRPETYEQRSSEDAGMTISRLFQGRNDNTNFTGDRYPKDISGFDYSKIPFLQIHLILLNDEKNKNNAFPLLSFNNPYTDSTIKLVTGDNIYE